MGKTTYQKSWESRFKWVTGVDNNLSLAHCICCKTFFSISASGISQLVKHDKGKKHVSKDPCKISNNQKQFNESVRLSNVGCLNVHIDDQISHAEIMQALHVVNCNYSFKSTENDNARFTSMFPDSVVAKRYKQGESKIKYQIQFGIAPYVKSMLKSDIKKTPFTFKFDETTTKQIKKQYDGYLQYWSNKKGEIVTSYCGSLFIGHCDHNQLVDHYFKFETDLELDSAYLLHVGMDGPNVNKAFEMKLSLDLKKKSENIFIELGTCNLHKVHTALRKGIKKLSFDLDELFIDIHFFFKLSSARREDYANLVDVTNLVAEFANKHIETRWLSMKYVAVRILEQWVNLKEYFLTFLPKQKNFNALFKTDRYKRICEALRNDIQTQGYLGFCAFSAQDFEAFLVQFQTESPMIHMLYPGMCKLLNSLLQKFILPKKLKNDNGEFKSQPEILMIDFYKIENHRKLSSIELGTKVKLLLHGAALPNLVDEKFRTECKEFYIASASYLQENLPFHVSLLKYAQFLRPKKRIAPGATSAISNLTLKVASVLEKQLGPVFHLNDISSTKESLCDKVRDQWLSYQNEVIPEHFYINSQLPTTSVAQQQTSYWSYAFSTCYLNSISKQSKYKRIDNYWSQVGTICDEAGNLKFPQLLELVKCVLTLSHDNSSPERGFSINKNFIEGHSTNLKEDTIVALRLVKDELNQVGGVMNFPITSNLIKCCKESHQRYKVYLAEQTKLVKAESEKVKQTELLTKSLQQRKTDLELIEADIRVCKAGIEVAETAIDEGNGKLQQALLKVKLDRTVCQTSQAMIDMGIKRKRELQINLDNLEKKKKLVK